LREGQDHVLRLLDVVIKTYYSNAMIVLALNLNNAFLSIVNCLTTTAGKCLCRRVWKFAKYYLKKCDRILKDSEIHEF
jgi:hypothetical protein